MSYDAPFAGLKVVDLSQGIAGPYAAMLLAQYGADVIKVEPPEGDWARALGKRYGDMTAFAIAANLGKRAIVLDLKTEEDRADRCAGSPRPPTCSSSASGRAWRRASGFGYEESRRSTRASSISRSRASARPGPTRERPAVDTVFQAFTGLMSVNRGARRHPAPRPVIVMDMATALSNFQAMAVALYARRDEPRGRYIESSLLRGGRDAPGGARMIQHHLEGGKPQPGLTPSGTFKASDGWINLTILRDAEFPTLCDALEIPAAKSDPRFATNDSRFANVAALNALLEPAFAGRTTADLSARLRAARLMHQRVNTYLEFLDDPQVKATGAVTWIEQPGLGRVPVPQVPGLPPLRSGTPRAVAPSLDQHRKEILAELGPISVQDRR